MNKTYLTVIFTLASCLVGHTTLGDEINETTQSASDGEVFEGIKYDYTLRFPEGWTLYTPLDAGKLPKQLRDGFIRSKLSALVLAPDNMSNISLTAAERKMDESELITPDDPRIQKINTATRDIKGHEWFIQEIHMGETINGKFYPLSRSYQAATHHAKGTIRITFSFTLPTGNHREIVDSVLASYKE